jgi:predicted permease
VGYSAADTGEFQRRLLAKLHALPGVTSVALSDWVPLTFSRATADAYPEGYVPRPHDSMEVRRASVSPDYFETMRIPIVQGREFALSDREGTPRVAIVDQTMAGNFWPGQRAIGKRMRIYDAWYTVVGVAHNSSHQRIHENAEPLVYLSIFQTGSAQTIIHLRSNGDAQLRAPAVEQAVHEINARIAVFDIRTLEQSTRMASMFERMETTFAGVFGLLALVLAVSGIYGVMAYRSQLRTREIGIRLALGATRTNILQVVLRQGMQLTGIGVALGLCFSLVLTRLLRGLLFGVSPIDPLTLFAVSALLLIVAGAASFIPAWKAMHTDPMLAIRAQ